jgi:hypothetical protein
MGRKLRGSTVASAKTAPPAEKVAAAAESVVAAAGSVAAPVEKAAGTDTAPIVEVVNLERPLPDHPPPPQRQPATANQPMNRHQLPAVSSNPLA